MTILHPEGGAISAAVEHILLYDEPLGWKEPRGSAFGGRRTTCGFSSCTIFPGSFTGAIVPFACMALSYMGILVITGGDVHEEKRRGFPLFSAKSLSAAKSCCAYPPHPCSTALSENFRFPLDLESTPGVTLVLSGFRGAPR